MKIRFIPGAAVLFLVMSCALPAFAEVAPACVFTTSMVLQREMPVPVWGTAAPDEQVTVTFDGQTLTTKADAGGKWKVALKPMQANAQSRDMTIAGPGNTVKLEDVLVGEVWLCSGQSNMTWQMRSVFNAKEEMAAANYPTLRMFTAEYATGEENDILIRPASKVYALHPQQACLGKWLVCTPAHVNGFSCVAYFFGRDMQKKLNVPVGLVVSTMGATAIESWMSLEALKALPSYRERALSFEELVKEVESDPKFKTKPQKKGPEADAQFKEQSDAARALLEAQKIRVAERSKKWFSELDAEDVGLQNKWMAPSFDVSKWGTVNLPVSMQDNPIGSPVATVWFRKDVTIPAEWVGKDLTLSLGVIDAVDETYINGVKVGRTWFDTTNYWEVHRLYDVPASAVTSTTVSVTLRLSKLAYHMAVFGPAEQMTLAPRGDAAATQPGTDGKVAATSLAGAWRMQKAQDLDPGRQPRIAPILGTANLPNCHYGYPGMMYNGLLHPVMPYAIRGAIWYQGEANAPFYADYRTLLPGLITSWRKEWGQGDFPFGIVQLADYNGQQTKPVERDGYTNLRESQAMALSVPNTFMATAVGYGESDNIHPQRKQEVGRQLAFSALNKVYGMKDVIPSGPVYKSMAIEGHTIRVKFDQAQGLHSTTDPLVGFAIAGEDRTFYFAKAKIDGDSVIVWSDRVPKPIAVRYAWATSPVCSLTNVETFSAFPFKTDNWDLAQIMAATDDKITIPAGWIPKKSTR